MQTKTQEQIMADLEENYYCPGAEECGILECQHAVPHAKTNGCDNGCFEVSSCVSLAEGRIRKGGKVDEIRQV